MSEENLKQPARAQDEVALTARVERSRAAWRRLGRRIGATTPATVARYLLVAGAVGALGWLIVNAWPALVPFALGAGLAYTMLPVVNSLDRVMPRRVAAFISMVAALGFLVLVGATIVPALIRQVLRLVALLPPLEELRGYITQMAPLLERLPEPLQVAVSNSAERATVTLRQEVLGVADNIPQLLGGLLLRLVNVVGAVLGLLVLPSWLLVVMADQRQATGALNRLLPKAVQPDFWAVARILDRSFRAFLQGQVTQGLVAGLLTYVAITVLNRTGYLQVEYPLVAALFVGTMELIPEIGPIVAVLVLGASAALTSPFNALVAILLYIAIHRLAGSYVSSRSRRRVKELHPAIMVMGAVALSELGLIWVLLSVPLLTGSRDLLSYAHGRLSDPPRPAGLITGEPVPAAMIAGAPRRRSLVHRRVAIERER